MDAPKVFTISLTERPVMKKELAETLQDFYQKVLLSEFATLKDKQLEHDNKLLDILGHFDSLYKRLDRLEDEYYSIVQGIKRIEETLLSGAGGQEILEKRIQEMKEQIKNLQERLSEIERKVHYT
jgi:chromosome segregation ATPase